MESTASKLREEGDKARLNRDWIIAHEKYTKAIQLQPDNHALYLRRSSAFRVLLNFKSALDDANKTLKIKPHSYEGWSRRATLLYDLKLETAAKEAHKRAIGLGRSSELFKVIGAPEYVLGQEAGLPTLPATLLEEWHKAHPSGKPPCVYENADSAQRKWKVFDRNGRELKYTIYRIHCETTRPYHVFVLHDLGGTDSLVGCVNQSAMKTFLATWKGKDDAFEDGISAVRIFGNSYEQINFHQGVFYNVQSPATGKQTPPKAQLSSGTNNSTPRSQGNGLNALSTNASNPEPEESTSDLSDLGFADSDLEKSEPDSEFDSEDEKPKRRKTESSIGVVFKFIPEQSDVTCSFPLAECRTSKALFTKARKFFQVFSNKDAGVSILSCRLPSQQEQHCLFENSEGQFELLLTEAEALMSGSQKLTIEVKCIA